MRYAQIVAGRVHGVFEYDPLPEFAPNIVMIELPEDSPVAAGWFYADGQFTEPEPAAPPMQQLLSENNAAYESATRALTADYPELEKDTWPTQDAEAAAWLADPSLAATPWIDLAAVERGIGREEYLRRTLVKSRQFKLLSSFLTGRRQRYEDAIKVGGHPDIDYALTPAVLAQLQQIAIDGMTLPAGELKEAL